MSQVIQDLLFGKQRTVLGGMTKQTLKDSLASGDHFLKVGVVADCLRAQGL